MISITHDSDLYPNLDFQPCPKYLLFRPLQTCIIHEGQARKVGSSQYPA